MVKLAENAGFGLDKIDDNWKVYNNTIPEYIIEFDSVILTFKQTENVVETSRKKSFEQIRKIIELIAKDKDITISEIAKATEISTRSVQHNIDKLKFQSLLKRIGPDKGGYWQVTTGK